MGTRGADVERQYLAWDVAVDQWILLRADDLGAVVEAARQYGDHELPSGIQALPMRDDESSPVAVRLVQVAQYPDDSGYTHTTYTITDAEGRRYGQFETRVDGRL